MKASLACPYSWDGPGGVQQHIRDPAEPLMDLKHEASVISPAGDDELPPGHVVPAWPGGSRPLQRRAALTSKLPGRSGYSFFSHRRPGKRSTSATDSSRSCPTCQ